MAIVAASALTWALAGLAIAIAAGGFLLVAVNVLAIMRPRKAGEAAPPRPLIGKPEQMTRRAFFRRAMGTGFMFAFMEGFGLGSLAFLWPSLTGGFGGKIALSQTVDEIKTEIRSTKLPFYFAPGRFYLVEYDEDDPKGAAYKKAGVAASGLMALYQRCVHLGCKVPFCATSQWFECPCHGSKYNRAGEYRFGPAPRGLDRMKVSIDKGVITVDTGTIKTGPSRGTNTTGQNPEGPFCERAVSE